MKCDNKDCPHERRFAGIKQLEELEEENKRLQETISKLVSEEDKIKQLKDIISEIEQVALLWDGRESHYYGNIIMKCIHPGWGETKEGQS